MSDLAIQSILLAARLLSAYPDSDQALYGLTAEAAARSHYAAEYALENGVPLPDGNALLTAAHEAALGIDGRSPAVRRAAVEEFRVFVLGVEDHLEATADFKRLEVNR